jgi:hypothetical protein
MHRAEVMDAVQRMLKRAMDYGYLFAIAGILEDRPRSGRPKRISDEREAAIVEATMKTTPKDATHWSVRDGSGPDGQFGDGAADLEETQTAIAPRRVFQVQQRSTVRPESSGHRGVVYEPAR